MQTGTSSTPATGSRTSRRSLATRGRLVAAARTVLRRPDYAAVAVAELTELADVGLGSFYNHFGSKEELFEAAVHDVLDEQTRHIDALIRDDDRPPAAAALALHVLLAVVDTDPEVAEIIARNGLRVLDADPSLTPRARDIMQHGRASGEFADVDEELLLALVAGALLGGLHTWSTEPERVTREWRDTLVTRALVMLGLSDAEAAEQSRSASSRLRHVSPGNA